MVSESGRSATAPWSQSWASLGGMGIFHEAAADQGTSESTLGLADAVAAELGRVARDIVPAYRSVVIEYDPDRIGYDELAERVRSCYRNGVTAVPVAQRTVTLPVVYGGEFGPDLEDVALYTGLTTDGVVAAHSEGARYRVAFLGFSPGYAYLQGLPPRLAMPRLASPRSRVPAGSVAIGGQQTAVYPQATPGGWRLIGRTAVPIFDIGRDPAALLAPGDRVVFRAVEAAEHEEIVARVRHGAYQPDVTPGRASGPVPSRAAARPASWESPPARP